MKRFCARKQIRVLGLAALTILAVACGPAVRPTPTVTQTPKVSETFGVSPLPTPTHTATRMSTNTPRPPTATPTPSPTATQTRTPTPEPTATKTLTTPTPTYTPRPPETATPTATPEVLINPNSGILTSNPEKLNQKIFTVENFKNALGPEIPSPITDYQNYRAEYGKILDVLQSETQRLSVPTFNLDSNNDGAGAGWIGFGDEHISPFAMVHFMWTDQNGVAWPVNITIFPYAKTSEGKYKFASISVTPPELYPEFFKQEWIKKDISALDLPSGIKFIRQSEGLTDGSGDMCPVVNNQFECTPEKDWPIANEILKIQSDPKNNPDFLNNKDWLHGDNWKEASLEISILSIADQK